MTFNIPPILRISDSPASVSDTAEAVVSDQEQASPRSFSRLSSSNLTEPLLARPRSDGASAPEVATPEVPSAPRNGRFRVAGLKTLQSLELQRHEARLALADALPTEAERRDQRLVSNVTALSRLGKLELEVLALERKQRDAYVAQIEALINTDDFRHPEAIKGPVERGADGLLTSPDPAIQAILTFVQVKFPEEAARIELPSEATLSLPLETSILLNAQEFQEGCKVRELHLVNGDGDDGEVDIDLSTFVAREAIKHGPAAFGEDARFRPLTRSDVGLGPEDPALAFNPANRPFAFLQDVRYNAESTHEPLRALVNKALSGHDDITLELRGRMGAQALNAVLTQKNFTPALGWAMVASLVGSGGLAFAMDYVLMGAVEAALNERFGENSPTTTLAKLLVASMVPAFAETWDSLGIKRVLGVFERKPLLPESMAEFLGDLKDSVVAGSIAAIGSIPNNVAALSDRWAMQPVSLITNQIAVSTSAAMIPNQIASAHEHMAAGVLERMNDGFLPAPVLAAGTDLSEAQRHAALANHVTEGTQGALEATSNSHGLAINSMGIGSLISLFTAFLPFDSLARAHVLPRVVQNVVTIMVNTPTEILSLGTGMLSGRLLGGMGDKLSTDDEKNRLVIALIANKAAERLRQAQNGEAGTVLITEEELRAIEHPSLALTFPAGRGIVNAMNGFSDVMARCWGALRGIPPERLAERVDVERLLGQHPENQASTSRV